MWREMFRSRTARGVAITTSLIAVIVGGLAATPWAQADAGGAIKGFGGKCVDVTWAKTSNWTPVQLWDCNGTGAQNWIASTADGTLRALGKCLDVATGSKADGTPVDLYDCNGTEAQRWQATSSGQLINSGSQKCLDARDNHAESGTPLQIWRCTGAPNQAWSSANAALPAAQRGVVSASSAKKGVSTWAFPAEANGIRYVGASWYYNWSTSNADLSASATFVPMVWGSASVNDNDLSAAQRAGNTLLGFNEPDLSGQARMSVEQALSLWPRLQQTGLRLGSPAVASGADVPDGWLDRFMTGAHKNNLRVDFIAVHWYGADFSDAAADQFMSYVDAVHKRYNLPIWVTEFGLINFFGNPRYPTTPQLITFIDKATTLLQNAPYVERYAWYALPAAGESEPYGLYHADSTPTGAGLAYRAAGN